MGREYIGCLVTITAITANDHVVVQPCNIFHKFPCFKILVQLSTNHKLGDTCNHKGISQPAGDQQEHGKGPACLGKRDGLPITYRGDGDGGHIDRIEKGSPFDEDVAEYAGDHNNMQYNKWLK